MKVLIFPLLAGLLMGAPLHGLSLNLNKEAAVSSCQSCGMPLKYDPEGGGTGANGSRSTEYCSYCWKGGVFTDGLTDVKEYQDMLYRMMRKKQNMPPWKAWFFTVGIPHLKRWKKQ